MSSRLDRLSGIGTRRCHDDIRGVRKLEVDGRTWGLATDGHILMAVCDDAAATLDQAKMPDAKTLSDWIHRVDHVVIDATLDQVRTWAKNAKPAYQDCGVCHGDPKSVQEECETCDGTGEHECDCGMPHECGQCEGSGHTEMCSKCDDGSVRSSPTLGKIDADPYPIHNLNLTRTWLAVLEDAPDDTKLRVRLGSGLRDAVYFHAADETWFAVQMPMNPDFIAQGTVAIFDKA